MACFSPDSDQHVGIQMDNRIKTRGITFDDVLLEPRYSDFVPSDVDVSTQSVSYTHLTLPTKA